MESTRPVQLNGIILAGTEITAAEFKTKKRPEKDGKGFIKYTLSIRPDFKTKKEATAPHALIVHATGTLQAWAGDPPEKEKTPPAEEELMICRVDAAIRYSIEKPGVSEAEIKKYLWHFQPQIALIVRERMRCLLNETPFAALPIPTEA